VIGWRKLSDVERSSAPGSDALRQIGAGSVPIWRVAVAVMTSSAQISASATTSIEATLLTELCAMRCFLWREPAHERAPQAGDGCSGQHGA
jgi:hypothetical protein